MKEKNYEEKSDVTQEQPEMCNDEKKVNEVHDYNCDCEDCVEENCDCEECLDEKCDCEQCQEDSLNDESIKLKYQLADIINRYKNLEYEFDNYRKRTREEMVQAKNDGLSKAIETILPALASFKKAKSIVKDENSLNGIDLIEKDILLKLEKLNVKKIDCLGKEFNPQFHNAVLLVEDKEKQSNIIVDEIESGFTLNDKVIKFSQVVVTK